MQKLRSIQVLRGVAAMGVALMHARYFSGSPMGGSAARLGAAGVDLFFLISGFIMGGIAKPTVCEFLFDRFWRVFPMWLLAATPWLFIVRLSWPVLLATFTLWPIFGHFVRPALIVGWTLTFEMLFYLSLAVAIRVGAGVPLLAFAVTLVAGAITRLPIFDYIGNPLIIEFLLGLAIARLPRDARLAPVLLVIAALCFAVAPMAVYAGEVATDAQQSGWRVLFWGVPAAMLVYGTISLEHIFARPPFAPLVVIGDASYSIYLTHLAVDVFIPIAWPIKFLASLLLGLSIWHHVERPVLAMKRTHRWHGSLWNPKGLRLRRRGPSDAAARVERGRRDPIGAALE